MTEKTYNVGIYCRLSNDDERDGESVSIENQKLLLQRYVLERGWNLYDTYIDDGYSGTNFNRPGVKRLIEDAKAKRINVIIVKDLSRFGRNYIEFGQYTDYLFPSLGCRFIALNNGIDTESQNGSTDVMCFLNLFNEFYSRDTSKKVKAVKKACAESGKFMGTYPSFGYKRDPEDKHHLIIDEETAPIVRRIFAMRASGVPYRKIATTLNEEGILPPGARYYQRKGETDPRHTNHLWADATIKSIIRNEVYIGNMVQGKYGTLSYKSRKLINKPKDEWICVEGTHEPIISRDTWDTVVSIDKNGVRKRKTEDGVKSIFAGLVYCADCGFRMRNHVEKFQHKDGEKGRYSSFMCGNYSRRGRSACTAHIVYENALTEIVLQDIREKARYVAYDSENLLNRIIRMKNKEQSSLVSSCEQEMKVTAARVRELLSKFVMLSGWIEAKTYIDDGYSGGNFRRPGFLEMLEDARNGVINLILVKDLSRLGRDFVEVGRYTDVVFPSLGVRFVSVLDCLDSEGDNTDMLHFRSLMNDYHLRDLSSKIKSVLHSKKAAGQFLSAYTPYGYRKSDEDKHRLVIDEYAAGVVRRIYEMRQSGIAYGKIAATLNQEGVLSPRVYWYQQSGKAECKAAQLWAYATVKVILHNEVYIGNLIMNHSGHRSYKDKSTIRKPESEWIRVEDAHEAIVSRDLWEAVQEINETAKHRVDGNRAPGEKLFSGKLICAGCGSTLAASTGTKHAGTKTRNGHYLTDKHYVTYQCGVHIRSGRSVCSPHSVSEITLSRIIAAEIRVQAQAVKTDESAAVERLKQSVAQQDEQYLADIRQEVTQLQRRLRELKNTNVKLYEDKIGGKISESTFSVPIQKSEQERLDKAQRLDALLSVIQEVEQKTAAIKDWTALIRKYMNVQVLDRETIDELIDHIEIGERTVTDGKRHQEIKVFYRFVGQIK